MATAPRHLHRPLLLLDPMLRGPSLVVEADHCAARRLQLSRPTTGDKMVEYHSLPNRLDDTQRVTRHHGRLLEDKNLARAKAGMCKVAHYVSYLSPLSTNHETHLAELEHRLRRNTLNLKRRGQPTRNKVVLMSFIVPVAICAFAITSSSAAQSASAVSASAPQAVPKDNAPTLRFTPSKVLPKLKAGAPSAVNLCTGEVPIIGKTLTDAEGLRMDTALSPCGESQSPTLNAVTGGNPPYHFQFETGSFPPLGMHMGMNGLLYGTPLRPPLGGYKPFRVCAVDMSGTPACHEVAIGSTPVAAHSSHVPIIVGAAALGGVAAVVGAKSMSNSSTGSSGGSNAGSCDGLSPTNACGPCSCTEPGTCNNSSSQCGGSVCYWQPGATAGQAPFCAGGKPD
jgi:hypothetical protein